MIFSKDNLLKLKRALLKLAEVATAEGVNLIYEGDELAVDLEVFVDGENGLEPAPDGEYTYENQVITVEGGKISNIADKPVEQPTEETPTEEEVEMAEETPNDEPVVEQPTEGEETPAEDEKDAKIAELEARVKELEAALEEANAKLAEPVAPAAEEELANPNPTPKTVTETVKYDYAAMRRKLKEIKK